MRAAVDKLIFVGVCVWASSALAQSPGIIFPAGAAQAASAPAAFASSSAPTNTPVTFRAPRPASAAGGNSEPRASAPVAAASAAGADSRIKVDVTKTSNGGKIVRARVPAKMAESEAAVAAQMPVPGYQIDKTSAAEEVPALAEGLVGVKPLPKWVNSSLDKTAGRAHLVVLPGTTEIVRIARMFPNRFVTPFENAEVVTTDENLTHDGVGGAVILATTSDRPVGIFIQDRDSDRAISLVLVPEDIPQRDIRLVLDESWGQPQMRNQDAVNASAEVPSAQMDYVEFIKNTMRDLATGQIPAGHALSVVQQELVPACQMPGLRLQLGQMLEGPRSRIAVYTASNPTNSTHSVQEAGCYRQGVLAVSAFPRPVLEPGQETEVYVVLRKSSALEQASSRRRPALVSQ